MMKKAMSLLFVGLFGLCGCSAAQYESISMSEGLNRMAKEDNYLLIDVRRADEYAAGHIPGALNIPNESIGSQAIAALPDKEQTIYLYCRSGNRSKQAATKLAKQGYTKLLEIGGIGDYPGELEYGN